MKHIPRKRFGQNFLQDPYIIQQIVECIKPTLDNPIIEIGPGLAALTKPLIERAGHIDVIELDRDIINFLQHNFTPAQISIHQGDALKFDFNFKHSPLRVVGNLPYNISTPILFHLSKFNNILDMTFMLQKEVVERICAQPNSSDYGKLTIMLQYKYKCRNLLHVPPESFYPAPKVDSAIIHLKPRSDYAWQEVNTAKLNTVVSQAFSQRRKTIGNSLKNLFSVAQLKEWEIDPGARAENLSIENFIFLSTRLD